MISPLDSLHRLSPRRYLDVINLTLRSRETDPCVKPSVHPIIPLLLNGQAYAYRNYRYQPVLSRKYMHGGY